MTPLVIQWQCFDPEHAAHAAGPQRRLLTARTTIGRRDCGLTLPDDYLSTRHAALWPDDAGAWHVEDMGSTNGTWLNESRVLAPRRIRRGDRLRVGRTLMILVPA